MIAITVVLATIFGLFVIGLDEQVPEPAPAAHFSFDHSNGTVTITHTGGDAIPASELSV